MTPGPDRHSGPRWWPAVTILLLLALGLVWLWGFGEQTHRQGLVEATLIASGLAFLLLLAWWLFFSRVRWPVRVTLFLVLIGLGALALSRRR